MIKSLIFLANLTLLNVLGINMTLANENTVRISFPYNQQNFLIENTDPAKIYSISDWDFSLNLYSRLVSFNAKGELVSGLAKKFYWKDDVAHFEIREDFQTIDGKTITPEDVVFSLKRLIKLNSNTHGKLENIICDFKQTDDINKSCTLKYRDWETDRKSTRLNSSHSGESRIPASA